ncbi:MAG: class I SAM-dependent methyltransferase [Nitrospirae bacterium]|nr:class I SAM-dependent methyltransferase [Nitrospirota bacterium]
MGRLLNIINQLHKKTTRDHIGRMTDNKIECMKLAKEYAFDYWDGNRRYGYGGYKYDGRWKVVAEKLIETYSLAGDVSILDVGCGKAFLLYEIKQLLPKAKITGFDISEYAIENSKSEIKENLFVYDARVPYPFGDKEFDLVISITTLHNFPIYDLKSAFREIERVGRHKYIAVESYRNDTELFNLECWALTCESFFRPQEWIWLMNEFGYSGDFEFIYFE